MEKHDTEEFSFPRYRRKVFRSTKFVTGANEKAGEDEIKLFNIRFQVKRNAEIDPLT